MQELVVGLLVRVFTAYLRARGLTVGDGAWVSPLAKLDWNYLRYIVIGRYATVVDGARIICHDASCNRRIGATWVSSVTIGERAYIGADAIILPGVRIGDDAIVGAGAVVTKDVPPGCVVAGVPATIIANSRDIDDRRLNDLKSKPRFGVEIYSGYRLSKGLRNELDAAIEKHGGFYLMNRV